MDGSTGSTTVNLTSCSTNQPTRRQLARRKAQTSSHAQSHVGGGQHRMQDQLQKASAQHQQGQTSPASNPEIFDIYDPEESNTGAPAAAMLPSTPFEYVSIQQLLQLPRFVPMQVAAPVGSSSSETTSEAALRSELQAAQELVTTLREECASGDTTIAELQQGTRRLREILEQTTASIRMLTSEAADGAAATMELRTSAHTLCSELEQAREEARTSVADGAAVITELRTSARTLRSELEQAREEARTSAEHKRIVNVLKGQLAASLASRRQDKHELQRCESLIAIQKLEHQATRVRLESATESRLVHDEYAEHLAAHNEMLDEQLRIHLQN